MKKNLRSAFQVAILLAVSIFLNGCTSKPPEDLVKAQIKAELAAKYSVLANIGVTFDVNIVGISTEGETKILPKIWTAA